MPIGKLNIPQIRKETPGVQRVIHFNNAGASLQPQCVYDEVNMYLKNELMEGGYETAERFSKELEDFYLNAATLIHANSSEIAFLESATAAWDIIFYSLPFKAGDRVITTSFEYASNFIAYLQLQKRLGIEIIIIPPGNSNSLDLKMLEKEATHPNTRLISITHIPTNGGTVIPAERVGEIATELNIPFLLDACQSAGQYPLDVSRIKCDFLSATGRKYLRGPRGTGFLYVNQKWFGKLVPFTLDLHSAEWTAENSYRILSDAKVFEKWECNFSGKVGLSKALKYACDLGIENIWERNQYLANLLRKKLQDNPRIEVLDPGPELSGIVSFRVKSLASDDVKSKLKQSNINVSISVPSGTLLDMKPRNISDSVRASVHYYNTEDEINTFCDSINQITYN